MPSLHKKVLCVYSLLATSLLIVGWFTTSYPSVVFRQKMTNKPIRAGDTDRLNQANYALPWRSHRLLPRLLSRPERDHCIELLSKVDDILREFNITYMLAYGTLLGSYVMHDILPWDDDLDIFMNIGDLQKIKLLFNGNGSGHYKHVQLLESTNANAFTTKLYSLNDPKAGNHAWRWPYIDISFYKDDVRQVSTYKNAPNWHMKRADFFPLTQRPLAWRWFPAPRNTRAFIVLKYKHFVCKSHGWDHRYEKVAKRVYSSNCSRLASHYPFVERELLLDKTMETLFLNGTSQYSVILE